MLYYTEYTTPLGEAFGSLMLICEDDKLTIGDGCKTQRVYGGYSKTGSANKNEVTIYDNVILDEVYGGYGKGSANENVVHVENVTAESESYIPLVGGLANIIIRLEKQKHFKWLRYAY